MAADPAGPRRDRGSHRVHRQPMPRSVHSRVAQETPTIPRCPTRRACSRPTPADDPRRHELVGAPRARRRGSVVIDPGPTDDGHLARLAEGGVELVLITHCHPDHTEAVDAFARLTGAPVRAVDRAWCRDADASGDGERIGAAGSCSRCSRPGPHVGLGVLRAPSPVRPTPPPVAVLTGDTVLGRGTTIIAHPDGALGPYLEALHRLRELGHARSRSWARARPGCPTSPRSATRTSRTAPSGSTRSATRSRGSAPTRPPRPSRMTCTPTSIVRAGRGRGIVAPARVPARRRGRAGAVRGDGTRLSLRPAATYLDGSRAVDVLLVQVGDWLRPPPAGGPAAARLSSSTKIANAIGT